MQVPVCVHVCVLRIVSGEWGGVQGDFCFVVVQFIPCTSNT